jgi:hypothetical protein
MLARRMPGGTGNARVVDVRVISPSNGDSNNRLVSCGNEPHTVMTHTCR